MSVFRHCLYKQEDLYKQTGAIEAMNNALRCGQALFSFNTSDLMNCYLNSHDEFLIKQLLNNLFTSSRSNSWSSLDSLMAINYLLRRNMRHNDLRNLLKDEAPGLSLFCERYCREDFTRQQPSGFEAKAIKILKDDEPSKLQLIHYLYHTKTGNLFESASYYRAYFDRFSSLANHRVNGKKLQWLYKEKDLKSLYAHIDSSEKRIGRMERIRQSNPLIHASSETLGSPTCKEDLEFVIGAINEIMQAYLAGIELKDIG